MTKPLSNNRRGLAFVWLSAGFALLVAAWLVPVNLKSVTPALLKEAGAGTRSVTALGRQWLDSEKPGPAALALAAARSLGDPQAAVLATGLEAEVKRQPELVAWGGWDPFLDPLFNLKDGSPRGESTPVLNFFIAERARTSLRGYLGNSRSQGVRALLRMREIDRMNTFVPVARAGGQTLDAVILLSALLYQGEHFSAPLQRELRALAETAAQTKELGALEPFFVDLLSLGKRLDWIQLAEFLRVTDSVKTVGEFAQLARLTPADLPLIYVAAQLAESADSVATYLLRYGRAGVDDLRLALGSGQGAVRQLLARQVPVNRQPVPSVGPLAMAAVLYPKLTLLAKYLGFVVGAFCFLRGLEGALFGANLAGPSVPRARSGALAVFVAGLLILATEPFLIKAAPPSEFQLKLSVPVLSTATDPASLTQQEPTLKMDTNTILSIGFFAALQIGMYLYCLARIRSIDREPISALLKLRLIENEENLFDGGLYIGIAGTASALVLQVLGVIQPNLLAAYSSNLFGIVCVALIKIRHVRPYKRQLILAGQAAAAPEAKTPLAV